jgi:hypothetical protein
MSNAVWGDRRLRSFWFPAVEVCLLIALFIFLYDSLYYEIREPKENEKVISGLPVHISLVYTVWQILILGVYTKSCRANLILIRVITFRPVHYIKLVSYSLSIFVENLYVVQVIGIWHRTNIFKICSFLEALSIWHIVNEIQGQIVSVKIFLLVFVCDLNYTTTTFRKLDSASVLK